ncbi:MAG: transaldolase family protein [Promethearchaeota archaeon]
MSDEYKSPLHETVSKYPTDFWNDSCSIEELTYAIEHGAVGATTNPVIVGNVLKKEMHLWSDRINQIIRENPDKSELEITWQLIEEVGLKGAELLLPVFKRENGLKGRLSMQTNPKNYRNADLMVEQAVHFSHLAPNVQVKIPVTAAGIEAIEEATSRGVNINATVCFCVPQAIQVAKAVERGLDRRKREGHDISDMTPVCTIMVGRQDDWLKVVAKKDGTIVNPGYLEWAGVACMKKAYRIYKEEGYRTRLLAAAYRNHLHWSEFIGGDVILTIPYKWQKRFNASDVPVVSKMDVDVPKEIIDGLYNHFPEFRRAYDPDGMAIDEFDTYGACVRTLRSFIQGYEDLLRVVRDRMIPDPDI